MDSGEGRFERFETLDEIPVMRETYPKSRGVFNVGEVLLIKDSLFKVKKITPFAMKLKLLKG